MLLIKIIVLAVIQGITEFLPISSSGHLLFFQHLFGLTEAQLTLDVLLHGGTLFSILYFFRKKIWSLLASRDYAYFSRIFIGILPAGIIGLLLDEWVESHLFLLPILSLTWLVNGIQLQFTDREKEAPVKPGIRQAWIVGWAQVIALLPGISRAGTTITAGVQAGMTREDAAEYSFMLAIPLLAGATLLKTHQLFTIPSPYPVSFLLTGFIVTFFCGIIALKLLYWTLAGKRFRYFSYYCIFMAFTALLVWIL